MKKNVMYSWNRVDELLVKIRDGSGKITYKAKVNINDTKKIADIFILLEKYGHNLDELFEEIRNRKDNLKYYEFTPKEKNPFFI